MRTPNLPVRSSRARVIVTVGTRKLSEVSPFGLLGIAFVGTFFWPVSPEAGAVLWATRYGWNPALVGLIAAAGQGAAHVVLFLFGDQIRRRWRWFDRQCEQARLRFGDRLKRSTPVLGVTSGLLGLPPTSVLSALAPGLGLRAGRLLPVMFAMRVIRFGVVAAIAARL
jgi:membrane protein YqaA with SNARE-associated domain